MTDKIEAVQRMQDYIQQHIGDPISAAELSKAAHFSPWYSARVFKELTGISPADYIRRLKLSKSVIKLRDDHSKIIDAAFDVGFASVDGYQRAFRKAFGRNPKEYAKNPIPLLLFIPYGVKFKSYFKKEITGVEKAKNIFIQVIEKPKRKVILKRGIKADNYYDYCAEVGCDIWGILSSIKSISGEPVCLWLGEKYRKNGTSTYVQGVEVDENSDMSLPEGFDSVILPAAKYLMFQSQPFQEEDYCEAIDSLQEAMDSYDPSLIGYAWDDDNPRIQLEPIGTRGYIELRAIKSMH